MVIRYYNHGHALKSRVHSMRWA